MILIPSKNDIVLGRDNMSYYSHHGNLQYRKLVESKRAIIVVWKDNPKKKHVTTYFRHHFTVPQNRPFTSLEALIRYDDGAVLYLNGKEIARLNMKESGVINYGTYALRVMGKISADEELAYTSLMLNPQDLLPGENVLAVEIHQANDRSSDLGFDLGLIGE